MGLEDYVDMLDFANAGITEKTSTCPQCKQEIAIYLENNRVSVMCKHCGYSQSMPLPKGNYE